MIGHHEQPNVQNAFRALADPTRRGILMFLSEQDMTIAEVSGHFEITRAAVKKHLTILEEGELISVASPWKRAHKSPGAPRPEIRF